MRNESQLEREAKEARLVSNIDEDTIQYARVQPVSNTKKYIIAGAIALGTVAILSAALYAFKKYQEVKDLQSISYYFPD